MRREKGKNTAASARARLLALAQSNGEDYQRMLGRFAIERFLYRLERSPHRDKFVLERSHSLPALDRPDSPSYKKGSRPPRTRVIRFGEVEEIIRAICEIQERRWHCLRQQVGRRHKDKGGRRV